MYLAQNDPFYVVVLITRDSGLLCVGGKYVTTRDLGSWTLMTSFGKFRIRLNSFCSVVASDSGTDSDIAYPFSQP